MADHTPGPWRVGYQDGSGNIDDDSPYCIQSIATNEDIVDSATIDGDFSTGEYGVLDKHDALLIAAAPDLLAALEQIRDGLSWPPVMGVDIAAQIARNAIAKAEGK